MGLLTRDVGATLSITWQLELDAESTWRHLVDLDTWPAWIGSPIAGQSAARSAARRRSR
jgi:hypothetical protein